MTSVLGLLEPDRNILSARLCVLRQGHRGSIAAELSRSEAGDYRVRSCAAILSYPTEPELTWTGKLMSLNQTRRLRF